MSDIKKMWDLMESSGAGVMKVVVDANGVEKSRMMIFVDGVFEVQAIKAAVEKIEDGWEAETMEKGSLLTKQLTVRSV